MSSCLGCAPQGSNNIEPDEERISVKVGSESIGCITIPTVERDATDKFIKQLDIKKECEL